jgi:hypothetical protein
VAKAPWIILGSVVVIGGGVGAYFLLRRKPGEVGATSGALSADGGGGGGGGGMSGGQPSQGYEEGRAYTAPGVSGSSTAGVVTAPAPAPTTLGLAAQSAQLSSGAAGPAAPISMAQNAGSISLARDTTTIGGRQQQAGAIGTTPTTGLAGVDTTALARSRSTPLGPAPAPTGPTFVKVATPRLSVTEGFSSVPIASASTYTKSLTTAPAPAPAPPPTTPPPPKPLTFSGFAGRGA